MRRSAECQPSLRPDDPHAHPARHLPPDRSPRPRAVPPRSARCRRLRQAPDHRPGAGSRAVQRAVRPPVQRASPLGKRSRSSPDHDDRPSRDHVRWLLSKPSTQARSPTQGLRSRIPVFEPHHHLSTRAAETFLPQRLWYPAMRAGPLTKIKTPTRGPVCPLHAYHSEEAADDC